MARHRLQSVSVGLQVPGVIALTGVWTPTDDERKASWEMYVELVTRVPIAMLREDEGLLRDALTSLYSIFGTTRDILRRYGPEVAQPHGEDRLSFGFIAVTILNASLRPLLAKWHPLLLDWERQRPEGMSVVEHERRWERATELRQALSDTRRVLEGYASMLEEVLGVPSLMIGAIGEAEITQP